MENIKRDIIGYIKQNRISTTEVADCLGKQGLLEGAYALNRRHHCVGEVIYTYAIHESNWPVHKDLTSELKDKVIFMDSIDAGGRALAGELVAKYTLLYRGAEAIISNGKMRDAHNLIKENYPIWCNGVSPIGCYNVEVNNSEFNDEILKRKEKYEETIAVCDDSGVVIIPKPEITAGLLERLVSIEQQEDIWFDCIDRLKWNTFETVCLKKYIQKN